MKRFSIFTACLSALFILALATAAFAQNPPDLQGKHAGRHGAKKLKKMDANHDGQLTRDEWKSKPKKFDKIDANHDGVITKEEIKARHHKEQRPTQ